MTCRTNDLSISIVFKHHFGSLHLVLTYLFILDAYGMGADGDSALALDAVYALGFIISATDGRYSSFQ